jgi:murein DD-endopeptidase MepM/ murein hydrolase activator NlpD
MSAEITRLTAENQQVQELAATLAYVEGRYSQLRAMLGADVMPEAPAGDTLPSAAPIIAQIPGTSGCYELGPSTPRHWPLDRPGVITRGPVVLGNFDEVHTGLDVALPTGTPIRAAGGGVVADAGSDTEYGLYVRIRHPEGYVSIYGHASRLLAATGDSVRSGQVVGLSGTTGRSTAPHLHFEVLKDGEQVDPRTLVRQRCVNDPPAARGN